MQDYMYTEEDSDQSLKFEPRNHYSTKRPEEGVSMSLSRESSAATNGSGTMSRRKYVDDDLRDNIYRLKLQVIQEKLRVEPADQESAGAVCRTHSLEPTFFQSYLRDKDIQMQLADTKKKYKKLKDKLKQEELERRLSSLSTSSVQHPQPQSGRFGQYAEMMMVQQTQTQNMILNHLMLNSIPQKSLPPAPPSFPTPIYYPQLPPQVQYHIPPVPEPPRHAYAPLPPVQPLRHDKSDHTAPSVVIAMPFPGNESQRAMRKLGLAALFCAIIQAEFEEKSLNLSDRFVFEIKIKEIITTLHGIYLNQEGAIFRLLQTVAGPTAPDLRVLITRSVSSQELTATARDLDVFLQNLVAQVTEVMPAQGSLGTEGRSLLSEFVQTNQPFPRPYLFSIELELLQWDSAEGLLRNVGVVEAQVLLLGVFLLRSLVMTVLLKPDEYGTLSKGGSLVARENLRLTASLLAHIYRTLLADFLLQRFPSATNRRQSLVGSITELQEALIPDDQLQPVIKAVSKSLDYAKNVLAKWAFTYVSKLRPV